MAEGTYEYECMRAELLGLDKPDYDEFMANKQEEQKKVEEEEVDIEIMKEVDNEQESLGKVTSGLDELNSILKKTQTKINRFKDSCGSFSSIIKSKVGGKWSSQSSMDADNLNEKAADSVTEDEQASAVTDEENSTHQESESSTDATKSSRKSDLSKAFESDMSRLDQMLEKAENAQYSMSYQNKQMKKYLQ